MTNLSNAACSPFLGSFYGHEQNLKIVYMYVVIMTMKWLAAIFLVLLDLMYSNKPSREFQLALSDKPHEV